MWTFANQAWLDEMFEQHEPQPGKWTLSFKLPGIDITREPYDHSPSQADKIDAALRALQAQRRLGNHRMTLHDYRTSESVPEFVLETCEAVQILIPPALPETIISDELTRVDARNGMIEALGPSPLHESTVETRRRQRMIEDAERRAREQARRVAEDMLKGFEGIQLWYSNAAGGAKVEPLFLLLGASLHGIYGGISSFSAFDGLVSELGGDSARSRLRPYLRDSSTDPGSFQERFRVDPIVALDRIGARVGTWRTITTLYEIRANRLYRGHDDDEVLATIGYPVFIWSGDFPYGREAAP